jgi:hypothetical protein
MDVEQGGVEQGAAGGEVFLYPRDKWTLNPEPWTMEPFAGRDRDAPDEP